MAVGRCRAALGQAPAQGTGSLEDPSLEEQELEENSGWNRSRSCASSSRAEPQNAVCTAGSSRPRVTRARGSIEAHDCSWGSAG